MTTYRYVFVTWVLVQLITKRTFCKTFKRIHSLEREYTLYVHFWWNLSTITWLKFFFCWYNWNFTFRKRKKFILWNANTTFSLTLFIYSCSTRTSDNCYWFKFAGLRQLVFGNAWIKLVYLFVCASSNRGSGVRIHVSGEGVGSTLCSPVMEVFFCRKEENSMIGGRSPDSHIA